LVAMVWRMFVVDEVGHRFGVHPFKAFDAAGIAAGTESVSSDDALSFAHAW